MTFCRMHPTRSVILVFRLVITKGEPLGPHDQHPGHCSGAVRSPTFEIPLTFCLVDRWTRGSVSCVPGGTSRVRFRTDDPIPRATYISPALKCGTLALSVWAGRLRVTEWIDRMNACGRFTKETTLELPPRSDLRKQPPEGCRSG